MNFNPRFDGVSTCLDLQVFVKRRLLSQPLYFQLKSLFQYLSIIVYSN